MGSLPGCPCSICGNTGARHRGKFKWKKYSRYGGKLRQYWQFKKRMTDRHWKVDGG